MTDASPTAPPAANVETTTAIGESVGAFLMKTMYELITNLRVPWSVLPQAEQETRLQALRETVRNATVSAVRQIARQGFSIQGAHIESVTIKEGVKATLRVDRQGGLETLAERVGSQCVLIFASLEEYTAGMDAIKAQADQPQLPLEDDTHE